ncbi:MAG: alpha-D-ribose 1-methylphosphonate 5-triphosphate diphosphatase [Pseudomonadota bacterium]
MPAQTTTTIRSRRIVTPDGVVDGTVTLSGSDIYDVQPGNGVGTQALDWGDDILMPGMIDIHTDNLEKHFMPRAGTQWDAVGAALAHDGQMATAGVTTVLDSLSLHGRKNGLDRGEALPIMMAGMDEARKNGSLRVDHKLHLRCEVSNPGLYELLDPFMKNPNLAMLSVMDHTPGQGQSGTMEQWRAKQAKKGLTEAEIQAQLDSAMEWRDLDGAREKRSGVAQRARENSIPLASHDDATRENIELAAELGCTIAEFPISHEAAEAARDHGMISVMGAPNLVRGGSHSGNASAGDIINAGLLDGLCSDYVPLSMLRAAFMMTEEPFNMGLSQAVGYVTSVPAQMSKLTDRGEVKTGLRADLLRVHHTPGGWPVIREVWSIGNRVT